MARTSVVTRTVFTLTTALVATCTDIALAAAAPGAAAPGAAAPVTAIHCGHLLDVLAGKMLGPTTVIVDGKRVREVVAGSQSPAGATDIDLSGQTCLPGLI